MNYESSTTQGSVWGTESKISRYHLASDGSDDESSILEMMEDNSCIPDGSERPKSYQCMQSSILSQFLSQTIINDFYQVKEHPEHPE